MRPNLMTRSIAVTLLAGSLAACDNGRSAPLAPLSPDLSASDSRGTTTARGGIKPRVPVDSTRPCREGELPGLTEQQIEEIRALYAAFYAEVADDLRFIAAVEKAAREAQAAGASPERIAAILSQADAAKRHVVEAEQRLREAIAKVLNEEQRTRHCVPVLVGVGTIG
jgi:hypothetical protein